MKPVDTATADSIAIVAARVGPTRLIDNMILGEPE
jgi:pantothenate synthetase